ncbi:MAG: decarboxylating 6-phosphogluconate dehydrogenase [Micrococcales bacterium]|nr:decarboxylating 6-phosphogluconate dehydrogenase [Micrococcales bacterium]
MQLGLIGLGKMGNNMRERLRRAGHEVVGYDRNPDLSDAASLEEMVHRLEAPRVVWVMVPHGDPTTETIEALKGVLEDGDLVIDGGNSHFKNDEINAAALLEKGIHYVDCGVSGGIWGLDNGYGLMAGGDDEDIERAMPIFDALRPEGPRDEGFAHSGRIGAGHYAKMVHNGIEYGLMQAYAEAWELLEAKDIVTDVVGSFKAWTRGTVVRSWLLDLMVKALEETPNLDGVSEFTTDSGEGRWTLIEGIDNAVPMPVLAASLFARFTSRQENSPQMQAVAALRGQFGGHAVQMLEDKSDVNAAARPKQDKGKGVASGNAQDSKAASASSDSAASAGPSSGSGSIGGDGGPTSGSGSTS